MRLDQALCERGLCRSRAQAKSAIQAGLVSVNGSEKIKPGHEVSGSDSIMIKDHDILHYVSRGALKLIGALDEFAIDVTGLRCLDAGASTGGFTQVLLERGAAQVIAVDVGTAQLAQALRDDPRVLSLEQTDIRALDIPPVDFICADLSFISLKLVFAKLYLLLKDNGTLICLLKPQFEAGRHKHGVVKDPKVHARVVRELCAAAAAEGFTQEGVMRSPIAGKDGNVEFLLYLRKGRNGQPGQ